MCKKCHGRRHTELCCENVFRDVYTNYPERILSKFFIVNLFLIFHFMKKSILFEKKIIIHLSMLVLSFHRRLIIEIVQNDFSILTNPQRALWSHCTE